MVLFNLTGWFGNNLFFTHYTNFVNIALVLSNADAFIVFIPPSTLPDCSSLAYYIKQLLILYMDLTECELWQNYKITVATDIWN